MSGGRLPIQSEHSGDSTELVPGAIYGLRHWNVARITSGEDSGLFLSGHYNHLWREVVGERATCKRISRFMFTEQVYPSDNGKDRDSLEKDVLHTVAFIRERMRQFIGASYSEDNVSISQSYIFNTPYDTLLLNEKSFNVVNNLETSHDTSGSYVMGVEVAFEYAVPNPCDGPVAMDCTCGFYASYERFFRDDIFTARAHGFFGIMRGYGHVTLGEKGFRAERADVVAICSAPHELVGTDKLLNLPSSVKILRSLQELFDYYYELTA